LGRVNQDIKYIEVSFINKSNEVLILVKLVEIRLNYVRFLSFMDRTKLLPTFKIYSKVLSYMITN